MTVKRTGLENGRFQKYGEKGQRISDFICQYTFIMNTIHRNGPGRYEFNQARRWAGQLGSWAGQ